MSLYGMMRTGVSGMNAQSGKLANVADNIANSDTTGYKRASTEFSSLVLNANFGNQNGARQSGGVLVHNRQHLADQGTIRYSATPTDMAISGNGFFVVRDPNGAVFLTRAGAFTPDSNGDLVNAAGFKLLGHPTGIGGNSAAVANGFDGLSVVNASNRILSAEPSRSGTLNANLPSAATVTAGANLPSANAATAQYAAKTSLIAYDTLGGEVVLDVYFAKTTTGTWEASVFDRAGATAGGFRYAGGPLVTQALTFDASTGKLDPASLTSIAIPVPGGETLSLDLKGTTQLGTGFSVLEARLDGHAPGVLDSVEISSDGVVQGVLRNGSRVAMAQIALADVPSPDLMTRQTGDGFVHDRVVFHGATAQGVKIRVHAHLALCQARVMAHQIEFGNLGKWQRRLAQVLCTKQRLEIGGFGKCGLRRNHPAPACFAALEISGKSDLVWVCSSTCWYLGQVRCELGAVQGRHLEYCWAIGLCY
ncbi:MAG: flagellar hook protein FlgE [Phyllobacteriaceae bacterium]|nr:flagellar hook protein FlgE [Phyllobacteriaceae bacterium]